MGFFSFIGSCISAVCSACCRIGGAIMSGISSLASAILPRLGTVGLVLNALSFLFTGRPEREEPEEIGMKAEVAAEEHNVKPEDFDSVSDYLVYLRQEIKLDEHKLKELSDLDRKKYQCIGYGLYIKDIEEKEDITIGENFITTVDKVHTLGYEGKDVANLITSMKENGINDMDKVGAFLEGKLEPGSAEQAGMYLSVRDMVEKHFANKEGADIKGAMDHLEEALRNE